MPLAAPTLLLAGDQMPSYLTDAPGIKLKGSGLL